MRAAVMLLAIGLLAACGGNAEADKEQSVLKAAQAAYYRKDYPTALQGFQILVDRNNARAQFFLGEMYLYGQGVEQDIDQALKLELAAADQGSTEAQFTLGGMYERGMGVPQDKVQAHVWYALSATTGDERALRKKAALETVLTPSQLEQARQLGREWIKSHKKQ